MGTSGELPSDPPTFPLGCNLHDCLVSSIIGHHTGGLRLLYRMFQCHTGEMGRCKEPAATAVIHEGTDQYPGQCTFRRIRRIGSPQIRPAPARIRKTQNHVRAVILRTKIHRHLIQCRLACGIARLLRIQGNTSGGIDNPAKPLIHHARQHMITDPHGSNGVDGKLLM